MYKLGDLEIRRAVESEVPIFDALTFFPQATMDVIEKMVPGIVEHMRRDTSEQTPAAILSRQIAGIRGKCLIINLPGSPKGVVECMDSIAGIIPHALEMIYFKDTSH